MADSAAAMQEEREDSSDGARAVLLATLAGNLLAQHVPEFAEPVLRLALHLDPRSFAARFALSEALSLLGRTSEALDQAWLAYAAARSGGPPDLIPLAETEAAAASLARAGEPVPEGPRLAEALGLAAAQRPQELWLLTELARLHLAAGAAAEAVVWYRRAAAIDARCAAGLDAALQTCDALPKLRLEGIADSPALADALRRVGLPEASEILCESLSGGAQNKLVKLTAGARRFALRLEKFPSSGWFFYAEECHNAGLAQRAGLSPELFYFDRADGTVLMDFLPGAMMEAKRFAAPDKAAAAGALYRTLHAVEGFRGSYDIFSMIAGDQAAAEKFCPPDLADFADLEAAYQRIRVLLLAPRGPPRATHNDPIPQNFIEHGDGLMLLDWQCGALSDPHWEIGAFSAQQSLPAVAEAAFFAAYFDADDQIGRARTRLMKPVCSFFWLGRALIRGRRAADATWHEEAIGNAKRLRELLAEPVFAESVAILEAAKT
jgi:hypothetical protein